MANVLRKKRPEASYMDRLGPLNDTTSPLMDLGLYNESFEKEQQLNLDNDEFEGNLH